MIRGIPTIKWCLLPIIITACGTAPVTDPPAHACSPPLDGSDFTCPPHDFVLKDKTTLPREEMRGDIDVWNPHHFIQMEQMFIRNARRNEIEKTMTQPHDAIDEALENIEWLKEE